MTSQEEFVQYFTQYLDHLKREIEAYENELDLWLCPAGISNSAGNLCTHLVGNLHHFIGYGLGDTGYVRDRPLEFAIKDVPRETLLAELDKTTSMIRTVLLNLPNLGARYPKQLRDEHHGEYSINKELVRLCAHLAYHVGQVNYHRRLLTD
ncbi:MAG: DUF1572 family protein [Saprospiraceae bacterium]|nr:DUF1572 family protein [Saprospiraceae bacterium]